jgi:ubiquinone/menaquinone biosynthesis C-methylase UbiE
MESKPICVKERMASLSSQELKESAEAYFASIKDPSYHLAKPFGNLDECPHLLTNFAQVLMLSAFIPGQSVLEFGAGSSWAGRLFNQLGLHVISLDISKSALELGKILKSSWPVFGNQPEHSFLEFDGHTINLPDESMDRIICLDSFHHVANPDRILNEFFRILSPNGLAVFSEPGPRHSLGAQSQQEMKNFNVIENNIIIEDIWSSAKNIGFQSIRFSLFTHNPITSNYEEYSHFQEFGLSLSQMNSHKSNLENNHSNLTLFCLIKGSVDLQNSKSRHGLVAEISLLSTSLQSNSSLRALFNIKNISKSVWLRSGNHLGCVNLGAHLFSTDGKLIDLDYFRHQFLLNSLEPNNSIEIECIISLPKNINSFVLEFDLVSEHVCWFANNGSKSCLIKWP